MKNNKYIFLVLVLTFITSMVSAQSPSLIDFGQNRVQYKDFKWQYYETDNFRIYFYKGGKDLGKYVLINGENIFKDLTVSLDFRLERKIDLLVYNDISDLRQSNIGIKKESQVENGKVKFIDNKLFVYFNGNHSHIDEQIKDGITKIFIEKHVTGSGLRETFKNSVAKNLPKWYLQGLKDYNAKGWNTKLENKLKDKILSGRFKDLSKLNEEEMAFVGHSLWTYVEEKYGEESVTNLMFLVKVNRSIDRGFRYVTSKSLSSFFEEWYYFYLDRYKVERKEYTAINLDDFIKIKSKKHLKIHSALLNPDGKSIAYLTNDIGKWKIHIYNIVDSTDKVIFKGGFTSSTNIIDLENPLIAWEKRGKKLTIIYELRDKFFIRDYDLENKELIEEVAIRKFQKIYGFSYAENSKNLIMSAMRKGQVDIFKYYLPSTKVTQITNDFYDDLQPSYIEIDDYRGYVFISNRPNDTLKTEKLDSILPNGTFDVFFYDLDNINQPLAQVSTTPNANESFPQAYNNSFFTFLSDKNGINNIFLANLKTVKAYDLNKYFYKTKENTEIDSILLPLTEHIDSSMPLGQTLEQVVSKTTVPVFKTVGESYALSNHLNGVEELSTSLKTNKTLELVLFKNKKRFVLSNNPPFKIEESIKQKNAGFKVKEITLNNNRISESEKMLEEEKGTVVKTLVFQSKFDFWETFPENEAYSTILKNGSSADITDKPQFKRTRTRQYFLTFKADDFNLSLDNKLIINSYQKFQANQPVYNNDGIGLFIKLGIVDLFENYRIHGGFKLSDQSIIPNEFYLTYENVKKRLDKEITFYRKSTKEAINEYDGQVLLQAGEKINYTNFLHLKLKYSLDILNSVRFKMAFRNDKTVYKSTESISLKASSEVLNWAILKVEFVHDHTTKKAENILNGFRANGYFEFQKEIPSTDNKIFNENIKLPSYNDGYLMVVGADARHYLKIYKTIVWANRLAYSSSFGTRKVVYYLGGSDGQLLPGFDKTNEVDKTQNYAFQSLAQNMRGLPQNTRNGNNYIVLNSEIRIPFFSAFSNNAMTSKFIESIQFVAFFDAGSAWQGLTPWSNDNIYTEIRSNRPDKPSDATSVVKLQIYKDPFIFAFGPGIRANLFDYFFRFDLGWAYDTGEIKKPKMHVSMTYDF